MNRTDAAREVKARYADYLQPARKKVGGKPTYICPLCGNGTGSTGDGMSIDPHSDGTRLKCFKCGFYGDIIDLYKQEHNCDDGEAFRGLYDFFGIEIDDRPQGTSGRGKSENAENGLKLGPQTASNLEANIKTFAGGKNATEGLIEPIESKPDFTSYYAVCREHISDPKAQEYLASRGLSNETAARYWLGYDPAAGFLIIPAARSYYIARNIARAAEMRYKNPTGVPIELFNIAALQNDEGRPVYVVEGAIDALSIIEAGGEALALNGTGNINKLLQHLQKERTSTALILCLDTDAAGMTAQAKLAEGLRDLNISYTMADICGPHKDPNEALTADRAAFVEAVAAAERGTSKPDNTADYIRQRMAGEIEEIRAQSNRKTGFANLDAAAGGIYAGLYVVGGISSVGKTTFVSQLADQMAEQGQHVLFFSMEQSRLEMISKSIARQTAKAGPERATTSLQVRLGAKGENITTATANYLKAVGDRASVIEGNYSCTVSYIRDYARRYSAHNGGVKPVLIIDYLQVLQPDADPDTGRKMTDARQIVDYNLTQLKRLSREGMPVFVVSSLNRQNYLLPIDFESFKESGGVEYCADVVWGLQLAAIHDELFISDPGKKTTEKRERLAAAKDAIPREVELVCLKNRYGSRYTANFIYYQPYDYFQPVDDDDRPWG